MRKLLLATAAVMGGATAMANGAFAQSTPAPVTVPTPVPYTLTPSPTAGPGTITVRLNVRIATEIAAVADSGRTATSVTPVASSATSLGDQQVNTKLGNYMIGTYARLFPGFDGIAGNGLKYGAAAEIREDTGQAPGGGTQGSISGADFHNNVLYWRREYLYFGSDQLGIVRMGITDGPGTLFTTGTLEGYDTGGWNGDLPGYFTGGSAPVWPFADVGQVYTTQKITYLSPQFAGFDFGFSWAPTSSSGPGTIGNCPYGITTNAGITGPIGGGLQPQGCSSTTATTSSDYARGRNFTEIAGRYRGSFGPIGVAGAVEWFHSGRVLNDATPQAAVEYRDQSVGFGGFQVTYGGLLVGGAIQGGAANVASGGGFALDPRGAPSELAYVFGSSYAFGPFIVGASYYAAYSAGSNNGGINSPYIGTRHEYGLAAGGTYNFAPGMNIFLDYLYGHRHQAGVDLLSGATSSGILPSGIVATHNNTQSQGIELAAAFRW